MILIALRILFGASLAYAFSQVWQNAQTNPQTGDLVNAFYLALCVILAIANAVVWAPYFGDRLSEPLTGVMTRSTFVDRKNYLLRFVHWLENHHCRRLTLFFCFLEGIHYPNQPAAFVIGLNHAKSGSWLEKVFALEVFKFDNAQHCMLAYEALRRHGIDPRPHHNTEVNMVLLSLDRQVKPAAEKIAVPPAPEPAPLKRDRRIRLFDMGKPGTAAAVVAGAKEIEADRSAASGELPLTAAPTYLLEPSEERPAAEVAPPSEQPGRFGRVRAFWRDVRREMREWDWH